MDSDESSGKGDFSASEGEDYVPKTSEDTTSTEEENSNEKNVKRKKKSTSSARRSKRTRKNNQPIQKKNFDDFFENGDEINLSDVASQSNSPENLDESVLSDVAQAPHNLKDEINEIKSILNVLVRNVAKMNALLKC